MKTFRSNSSNLCVTCWRITESITSKTWAGRPPPDINRTRLGNQPKQYMILVGLSDFG